MGGVADGGVPLAHQTIEQAAALGCSRRGQPRHRIQPLFHRPPPPPKQGTPIERGLRQVARGAEAGGGRGQLPPHR